MPIWHKNGTWAPILLNHSERLRRSSQTLSVIGSTAYLFGGEVQPRQPMDNHIDIIDLVAGTPQLDTKQLGQAPSPRVGSSSVALNGCLFIFSGRGGVDMAPVEEYGALWCYDPTPGTWSLIKPSDSSKPYPPARSYHCMAAAGDSHLFVHAGCPASGRLSDLWKFDLTSQVWTQLSDAPPPERGGTSIAFSKGKIYRMHGFDGKVEQGGSLDIFDVAANTWTTKTFDANGRDGPEPRSVCVLLPVKLQRKEKLITLFGERDPSSLGHAGAGKMLNDVWVYDIDEDWWTKLEPSVNGNPPAPRGWFDADVVLSQDGGNDRVVLHGGLGEDNERLADLWLLSF
ncbi:unnamed protein product [Periconia digitata]|uniref:Galactose oxidase n=1 Tax=Periconia digitata TaxID=1303443 RepID=A0A9W4UP05_9PLEO|nr:unnamed protein product [Periconia digitata]